MLKDDTMMVSDCPMLIFFWVVLFGWNTRTIISANQEMRMPKLHGEMHRHFLYSRVTYELSSLSTEPWAWEQR